MANVTVEQIRANPQLAAQMAGMNSNIYTPQMYNKTQTNKMLNNGYYGGGVGTVSGGGNGGDGDKNNPPGSPFSYGYGYGGGGVSAATKDNILKNGGAGLQATFDNAKDTFNTYKLADEQNTDFANLQIAQSRVRGGADWFQQQKKLQSTEDYLKNAMGANGQKGSGYDTLNQVIARQDDNIDFDSIKASRENVENIQNTLNEKLMSTNNSRNSLIDSLVQAYKNAVIDSSSQLNAYDENRAKAMINDDGTINTSNADVKKYFGDIINQINAMEKKKFDGLAYSPTFVRENNARNNADALNIGQRYNAPNGSANTVYENSLRGYERRV